MPNLYSIIIKSNILSSELYIRTPPFTKSKISNEVVDTVTSSQYKHHIAPNILL
jgi:hypothetical protein